MYVVIPSLLDMKEKKHFTAVSHPHWAQNRRSVSLLHITLYVVIPPLLGTEEKKYFSATHDAVCHDPTIVEHIRDKAFHSYT